ncbi:hypothetical protein UFOVP1492_87 [uncultured Caudovirales phage]|uniref:Uncharacterized protein n=1 Tax=uncultured Caudovirales phage TaxID=2100421 RepID=A0A6J5ST77_9CAUD|nr:hypothetical protein UFOVP1127_47 [uncultured Caudovirales phage]CAB4193127.1 hypothetical protein UFOVP1242_27 [uncultured Caudovirales phage]CAB4217781.1 hypothetical protein UFOVP1492_87 [uncultured Caudovirales phage]CAB5231604.1 hypothetical protein UFOVP1580_116 [uncultured Caudovirales phage]
MNKEQFMDLLAKALPVPFDYEKVVVVEENCGTCFVELQDGTVFTLQFQESEKEED